MKTRFFYRAVALLSMLSVFACSKQTEMELTDSSAKESKTYSMTVVASKGEALTKALNLDGNTLNASWTTNDPVKVYNVSEADEDGVAPYLGTIYAQSSGVSTTLKGDIEGTITPGDRLLLKYLDPDYTTGQEGTLEDIANFYDGATAYSYVTEINDNVVLLSDAQFTNQQAIVKFTLKNSDNGKLFWAESLHIWAGDNQITITESEKPREEFFVAIPAVNGGTVQLQAKLATAEDLYFGHKANVTLENGKYYNVTVNLTKGIVVYTEEQLKDALNQDYKIIRLGGNIALENYVQIHKTVTINLSDYTLSRKDLTSADPNGHVIEVFDDGDLTLIGGPTQSGALEGGFANHGGGICNYGKLTLEGVNIRECHANDGNGLGGGIYNGSGATLVMKGGSITNCSSYNGGGLYNVKESAGATLSDVLIGGNVAKSNGGGIYNQGTLNMEGALTVSNNTNTGSVANNTYLEAGHPIQITGSLEGSNIGVNMSGNAGTVTSGLSGKGNVSNFFSDFGGSADIQITDEEATLVAAVNNIPYIERSWDGSQVVAVERTISAGQYTLLNGTSDDDTYKLKPGWYVVKTSFKAKRIIIDNDVYDGNDEDDDNVNLILCDGAKLECHAITINWYSSLNVYGQNLDTGKIVAQTQSASDDFAAIGSDGHTYSSKTYSGSSMGKLVVHGGDISADTSIYSSGNRAAIGGSTAENSNGGDITIYHGKVFAKAGSSAPGIGGGYSRNTSGNGGTVRIYGGEVTAEGGRYGAGIGGPQGGNGGDVTIYGGKVYAYGGVDAAGIGSGREFIMEPNIQGGTLTVYGGEVHADGQDYGAGIGAGINAEGADVKIYDGFVEAYGGKNSVSIGSELGEGHHGTLEAPDVDLNYLEVYVGYSPESARELIVDKERWAGHCSISQYATIKVK